MRNFLFLLLFLCSASAQTIQTGLAFLKLGIGARSVAMGEAYTSMGTDHGSFFYNPAQLNTSRKDEVMLMHKQWIEESSAEYLGATVSDSSFNYSFSLLSFSAPGFEIRTKPGPMDGIFEPKNFSLGFSLSSSFSDDIFWGVTAKFLYEKIFVDEASGYGFDIGGLYKVNDNIQIGTSLLNIGKMNKLRSEATPLPTTIRIGGSYSSSVGSDLSGIGAVDFVKTFNDDLIHINLGAELTYKNLVSVRAGYQTGFEDKSFSTGFGTQYGILKFDYAFVPFTSGFTSTHTFSLSFLL